MITNLLILIGVLSSFTVSYATLGPVTKWKHSQERVAISILFTIFMIPVITDVIK